MNQFFAELAALFSDPKTGLWLIGLPAWTFGAIERSFTAFSHHPFAAIDLLQILTALFFLGCWLLLKPTKVQSSTK